MGASEQYMLLPTHSHFVAKHLKVQIHHTIFNCKENNQPKKQSEECVIFKMKIYLKSKYKEEGCSNSGVKDKATQHRAL